MDFTTAYNQVQGTKYILINKYKSMIGVDISFQDLESVADIGIWKAFQNFDESKAKWNTHAYNMIRFAILDEINLMHKSAKTNASKENEDGVGVYMINESTYNPDNDGVEKIDTLYDDTYIDTLRNIEYELDLKKLSPEKQKVAKALLDGAEIADIARMIGKSKVNTMKYFGVSHKEMSH
jgi:DNA-directed RNA polymerase specialized sigma24 family protein